MHTLRNRARRSVRALPAFPSPDTHPATEARHGAPIGRSSGVQLTPKGEAYCAEHDKSTTVVHFDRPTIERRLESTLDLVTALIALLDEADGDENLEPSLLTVDDREGGDVLDLGEPSLGWTDAEASRGCSLTPSYECEVDGSDDEPSVGFDTGDGRSNQWTPEYPFEESVHAGDLAPVARNNGTRRRELRSAGQGNQGRFHGVVLNTLPDRYRMQVEGDCLSPEIANGASLEFSKTERFKPGDFVAIYRWAQFVGPGEWQVVVKRLVADFRNPKCEVLPVGATGPCVLVEMLNPRKRLIFPAEQIQAVHKVVRIVPEAERGRKYGAHELAAPGSCQ